MQKKLSKLVWSTGCTSWALTKTGVNIAMYPEYQFLFWLRSVFIPSEDFEYIIIGQGSKEKDSRASFVVGGWKGIRQTVLTVIVGAVVASGALGLRRAGGFGQVSGVMKTVVNKMIVDGRGLLMAK